MSVWRIDRTSCACGGSYAWLRRVSANTWEMWGCVCHSTPERFLHRPLEIQAVVTCPNCEGTGVHPPGDPQGIGCWDCFDGTSTAEP